MTQDEVMVLFKRQVDRCGGTGAFGRKHHVPVAKVSATYHGHAPISSALLTALGLEAVVLYRPISPQAAAPPSAGQTKKRNRMWNYGDWPRCSV